MPSIFGPIVRAAVAARGGQKRGRVEAREWTAKREDEAARRQAQKREHDLDAIRLSTEQIRANAALTTAQAKDDMTFEEKERLKHQLALERDKARRRDVTSYSERRDREMRAYRDHLVKSGQAKDISQANEMTRRHFLRDRPDPTAALLEFFSNVSRPPQPDEP